eukprot:s3598_g3.t1
MALVVPSDESEEMLHLEEQLDREGQMQKEEGTKPSFSRALLLLVIGLVCIVSLARARLSNLSSFRVFSGTASTASTALWDEFMDFGSGNELDRYRRKVSNDLNGDNDDELVSWHTVLCHAIEDNKVRIVREVARRHPGSLHGGCSAYETPLDYAIHQRSDMVEVLLWAGEFVSDRTMVDVACHQQSWHPQNAWNQRSPWNQQNPQGEYTGTTGLLMILLQLGNGNANAKWNGETPITCAAKSCSQSEVQVLMQAGAYINTRHRELFRAARPMVDLFSAIQAAQVGLVWRTSRKLVHLWAGLPEDDFKDLDPWEPSGGQAEGTDTSGNQGAIATTGTSVATPLKERVLKMSSLVDQTDDSELNPASREQVDGWLAAYVSIIGSVPSEEEEPSESQLAALHRKVFMLKGVPYADFAIFTPFGRRCQKAQNCWGLICQAEDKARAEHLSKLRRKLLMDFKKGMPMPDDWSEENPWTTCFRMLVVDEEYWNEQVRHPAAAWTASGSRGAPLAPADQIALAHVPGGNEVADVEKEDKPDGKRRQSNRDKRMARAKRQRAEREELEALRRRTNSSDARPADKGKGKGKSKDQAGEVKPESDEEQPEHITSSSWRTAPVENKPERAPERTDEPWTPMRVTQALEASKNFAEFKEKRQFIYVHLFSGATDVLGEAILRLAKLDGMNVEVRSFDRNSSMYAVGLSKEQPFNDILDAARGGLIDGTHAGFPCGSFSRARYNQGHGPPPVRSLEFIYGLVTNDERQQKEADVGSLLAIRSIQVTAEVLQTQRKRRVPECGTLENPPGSESQAEGPAWQLPEMLAFLK